MTDAGGEIVDTDFDALLIKYMAYIREQEGTDYVSELFAPMVVGFTPEEIHALKIKSIQAARFLEYRGA